MLTLIMLPSVPGSVERRALDRDAVQQAALAVIVVDREVPGRAVVPQRQRALAPMKAAGEFGPRRVAIEVLEQRSRLLLGPALEPQREAGVDIKRATAGLRMADDDGMNGVLGRQLGVADAAGEVAAARLRLGTEHMPARMAGAQPVERRLEPVGERVVSRVHAGEQ